METNLYKLSNRWAVVCTSDNEPHAFETIETASDYLMALGVEDEQIDLALVDMMANNSTRANFGVNGSFVYSDGARVNGRVGTA